MQDRFLLFYFLDTFQQYDWGPIGNQEHYGTNTPPMYNISGRTPPIGLFWGQNDWLATPEVFYFTKRLLKFHNFLLIIYIQDLVTTRSELQNVVVDHMVEWESWNHLDFVW